MNTNLKEPTVIRQGSRPASAERRLNKLGITFAIGRKPLTPLEPESQGVWRCKPSARNPGRAEGHFRGGGLERSPVPEPAERGEDESRQQKKHL